MSGKRILDAIALLRAIRNVAYNHFAIRLSQAELYSRTSSITKLLAQRYPLTSSLISQRFSQSAYDHNASDSIPHEDKHARQASAQQEANIPQDQHNTRSEDNSAEPVPQGEDIKVEQANAKRYPLPDGTIPPDGSPIGEGRGDPESQSRRSVAENAQAPLDQSAEGSLRPASSGNSTIPTPTTEPLSGQEARVAQRQSEDQIPARSAEPPSGSGPEFSVEQEKDVYYQPPGQVKPVLSALPRMRVPKVENDVQGGDSHLPKDMNADVYYSGAEQGQDTAEPTEEQLSQLFHTPRAASLLGKKDKYMPGGKRSLHTSAVRRQNSEAEKQELQKLGQSLATDVGATDVSFIKLPAQPQLIN